MKRHQNAAMRKLLHDAKKCELCGYTRGLEVHHIIPVSFGGPEEDADNMIVICRKCHSLLTPRSILTKAGIERAMGLNPLQRLYKEFYTTLDKLDGHLDVMDAFDLFDKLTDEYSLKYYGAKAHL